MLPMQTNSTANSAFGINDLGLKILFKKPLLLSTIQHKPECYESTAYSIVLNPEFLDIDHPNALCIMTVLSRMRKRVLEPRRGTQREVCAAVRECQVVIGISFG